MFALACSRDCFLGDNIDPEHNYLSKDVVMLHITGAPV